MRRYIASRLGWAAVLVGAVTILNFVITHILPGSPISALVGEYPAPPAYVAQVERDFGLDQPLLVQLWLYVVNLAQGNLGFSFVNHQPVLGLIAQRAVYTLLLMVPALLAASIAGVLLGALSARHPNTGWDKLVTAISVTGYSIPVFWLAQVMIVVFAVGLRVLPAQGILSVTGSGEGGLSVVTDYLRHLILPAFVLALAYSAVVTRVSRASMLEATNQDFTLLALAKGLSPRRVFWRHIFPNSLVPIITVIGYNLGYALTGAILTESVFGWPGLGYLFITSLNSRDYPVVDGIFMFAAIAVVVSNLLTDIAYAVVDPRIARTFTSAR
jgi:ABC-type dipeptide/oligopeptide/nickel transport system permease component